jgi:hypothetical protein
MDIEERYDAIAVRTTDIHCRGESARPCNMPITASSNFTTRRGVFCVHWTRDA